VRERACCTAGAPPGPATPAQGPRCTPWRWERLRCRPVRRQAARLRRERVMPDASSGSSGSRTAVPSQLRGCLVASDRIRTDKTHSDWVMANRKCAPAPAVCSAVGAWPREGRLCWDALAAPGQPAPRHAGRATRRGGRAGGLGLRWGRAGAHFPEQPLPRLAHAGPRRGRGRRGAARARRRLPLFAPPGAALCGRHRCRRGQRLTHPALCLRMLCTCNTLQARRSSGACAGVRA